MLVQKLHKHTEKWSLEFSLLTYLTCSIEIQGQKYFLAKITLSLSFIGQKNYLNTKVLSLPGMQGSQKWKMLV